VRCPRDRRCLRNVRSVESGIRAGGLRSVSYGANHTLRKPGFPSRTSWCGVTHRGSAESTLAQAVDLSIQPPIPSARPQGSRATLLLSGSRRQSRRPCDRGFRSRFRARLRRVRPQDRISDQNKTRGEGVGRAGLSQLARRSECESHSRWS
jgi:hypothetical protein